MAFLMHSMPPTGRAKGSSHICQALAPLAFRCKRLPSGAAQDAHKTPSIARRRGPTALTAPSGEEAAHLTSSCRLGERSAAPSPPPRHPATCRRAPGHLHGHARQPLYVSQAANPATDTTATEQTRRQGGDHGPLRVNAATLAHAHTRSWAALQQGPAMRWALSRAARSFALRLSAGCNPRALRCGSWCC